MISLQRVLDRWNKPCDETGHLWFPVTPISPIKYCCKCKVGWAPSGMKMGQNSVISTDSYVEFQTGVAPANPSAGFVRQYATSNTSMRMRDSTGTETTFGGGATPAVRLGTAVSNGAAVTASSVATSIAADVAAHTKGAWVELIASTGGAAVGVLLTITNWSNGNVDYLIDLGTGAAASESVKIPNIYFRGPGSSIPISVKSIFVPLSIAASTRVALRCQSEAGSATLRCQVTVITGATASAFGTVTAYGVVAASSDATQIDPGAVAHTKGSWVELTASSSAIDGLLVIVGNDFNVVPATTNWLIDIGTGAAASEVVLLGNLPSTCGTVETGTMLFFYVPISLAAGTRIAARCQCDRTVASERILNIAVYGMSA